MHKIPRLDRPARRRLITRGRKSNGHRTALRFLMIAKLGQGLSRHQVARDLGCVLSTVVKAARRFVEAGEEGLLDRRAHNGVTRVDARFREALERVLHSVPTEFGWQRTTWTRDLLGRELERRNLPPREGLEHLGRDSDTPALHCHHCRAHERLRRVDSGAALPEELEPLGDAKAQIGGTPIGSAPRPHRGLHFGVGPQRHRRPRHAHSRRGYVCEGRLDARVSLEGQLHRLLDRDGRRGFAGAEHCECDGWCE